MSHGLRDHKRLETLREKLPTDPVIFLGKFREAIDIAIEIVKKGNWYWDDDMAYFTSDEDD
jgi:hypothetical protein